MPHPLEIFNIVRSIVRYLSRNDQVHCLTVSPTFYCVLVPILWYNITIRNPADYRPTHGHPTGPALERNKIHIRELVFYGVYPYEYLNLKGCCNLHTLHVLTITPLGPSFWGFHDILIGIHEFIRNHSSTLSKINIDPLFVAEHMPPKEFLEAIAQCSNQLKELEIGKLILNDELATLFLKSCESLKSLIIRDSGMKQLSENKLQHDDAGGDSSSSSSSSNCNNNSYIFPQLRRIEWINDPKYLPIPNRSYAAQASIIRNCPNLEYLSWSSGRKIDENAWGSDKQGQDLDSRIFINTLSKDPWELPHLDILVLPCMQAEDSDFATLLTQLNQLKILDASQTKFGIESFQALMASRIISPQTLHRRLCENLEILKITRCRGVTSFMAQALLANCPKLRIFHVSKLKAKDIARGEDWVCRELTVLAAHVEVEEDDPDVEDYLEMHRATFSKIATLTKLENLSLNIHGSDREPQRTLELRLEIGLDILAPLKELQRLWFPDDIYQRMSIEDITWIANQWPKLDSFFGQPTDDIETLGRMKTILQHSGVRSVYF